MKSLLTSFALVAAMGSADFLGGLQDPLLRSKVKVVELQIMKDNQDVLQEIFEPIMREFELQEALINEIERSGGSARSFSAGESNHSQP